MGFLVCWSNVVWECIFSSSVNVFGDGLQNAMKLEGWEGKLEHSKRQSCVGTMGESFVWISGPNYRKVSVAVSVCVSGRPTRRPERINLVLT